MSLANVARDVARKFEPISQLQKNYIRKFIDLNFLALQNAFAF